MKADFVIDPTKDDAKQIVMDKTGGIGVDVVLEMAGHPNAIRTGFDILRRGGRMSLLGIPSRPISLDFADDIIFKGATIQGINGRQHVSDVVSDDRAAEGRQAGSASGDYGSASR